MYLWYPDAIDPGVIGTGLFLGSANSLRHGGPVGLLLGYLVVGSICYSVMVSYDLSYPLSFRRSSRVCLYFDHHFQISLGEMISYLPVPGGHIKLAERFVDPAFSFVRGPTI